MTNEISLNNNCSLFLLHNFTSKTPTGGRHMLRSYFCLFLFIFSVSAYADNNSRTITINNMCPFDVSLQSAGSNASVIACSPNDTSAQSNCPDNFVCYSPNVNINYCVAGSAAVGTTLPLSLKSQINLTPQTCTSGQQVSDTTSVSWGQCTCTQNSDCDSGQTCQSATPSVNQCYWKLDIPNDGKLAKSTGSTSVTLTPNSTDSNATVTSGKLYAKFGCNDNGQCLSDNTQGAPATLIEFTFQNSNDWYDVSYINGINLPAIMQPVLSTSLDFQSNDPYRCMAAGGDASTLNNIANFQTKNILPSNTELQAFACTNDYATTFDANKSLLGYNFVSTESAAPTCSQASDCSGDTPVCGLTMKSVTSNSTQKYCGNRLGYWTYAQLCSANGNYANTDLGVDCSVTSNYSYALCKNQSTLTDTGPGRSCFNSNTTSSGQTCCGYNQWSNSTGSPMPFGKGDSAVSGVDSTAWVTNILPVVKPIKEGCFLAYSYQYDDPFSTFTCSTNIDTQNPINLSSYDVTLCPDNDSAGINPPTPTACVASAPSGFTTSQFTATPPSGINLTVNGCVSGTCNKTLSETPSGSSIYTDLSSTDTYEFTATNASGTIQTCQFNITNGSCIERLTNSANCQLWNLPQAAPAPWAGRSISIPDF